MELKDLEEMFKMEQELDIPHRDRWYNKDFDKRELEAEQPVKNCNIPDVMPRISHFIDENGTTVDLNAEGVNVRLKRDGTHEYFLSFGFAGIKMLTPVYGA